MSAGNEFLILDLVLFFTAGLCIGWIIVRHINKTYCHASRFSKHPLAELLTALVISALYIKFGPTFGFAAYAVLMVILIAVMFVDIDVREIPNRLVLAGIAAGAAVFAYNLLNPGQMQYGDGKWWTPLAGMFLVSGALLLAALLGAAMYKNGEPIGMGDVKVFAPIGLFLGWKLGFLSLMLSVLTAGIAGMLSVAFKKKGKKDAIPFAPFIALGTFISIMSGWNLVHWFLNGV